MSNHELNVQQANPTPLGWLNVSLKRILAGQIVDGPHETPDYVDEGVPFISVDSIDTFGKIDFKSVTRYITMSKFNEYNRKTKLKKNDILFTKAATIGKVALVTNDEIFMTWSPIAILKSNKKLIHYKYLYHVLRSSEYLDHVISLCNLNTQLNIGMKVLENSRISLPICIVEQRRIAAFLDLKTAQFDSLIEKKERLIEKLEEARKSLISEVVTGKVRIVDGKMVPRDPGEMVDSGVEWLGNIPTNWSRTFLKFVVSKKITDGPHETPDFIDEGIPFLSAEAIVNSKISFDNKRGFISEKQHKAYKRKSKVAYGDILFCKSGSTTGKSALVNTLDEFGIWSPLAIVRAGDLVNNILLFFIIQSKYFQTQVQNYWSFGTQPNIGMGALERLIVPFSNDSYEQTQICEFLEKKTTEIDLVINKTKNLVQMLKSAKQSLISEAVTGKIDLRDWELNDASSREEETA